MVINGDDRQSLNLDFFKLVNSVVGTAVKHPFTQEFITLYTTLGVVLTRLY